MAGACGSCRICTRPVWVKFLTLITLWDFYVWMATLLIRRCPNCKHRLGIHRTQLGAVRIQRKAQFATPYSG